VSIRSHRSDTVRVFGPRIPSEDRELPSLGVHQNARDEARARPLEPAFRDDLSLCVIPRFRRSPSRRRSYANDDRIRFIPRSLRPLCRDHAIRTVAVGLRCSLGGPRRIGSEVLDPSPPPAPIRAASEARLRRSTLARQAARQVLRLRVPSGGDGPYPVTTTLRMNCALDLRRRARVARAGAYEGLAQKVCAPGERFVTPNPPIQTVTAASSFREISRTCPSAALFFDVLAIASSSIRFFSHARPLQRFLLVPRACRRSYSRS